MSHQAVEPSARSGGDQAGRLGRATSSRASSCQDPMCDSLRDPLEDPLAGSEGAAEPQAADPAEAVAGSQARPGRGFVQFLMDVGSRVVQMLGGRGGGKGPKGRAGVQKAASEGVSGPGGSMPHQAAIQGSFGKHDVSSVRAHTGGAAAGANATMGSQAFAKGRDVAFASSNPSLHTAAHEAAHVVQQQGGVQVPGGVGKAGDSHERHADKVADRVVRGRSSEDLLDTVSGPGAGGSAVQHKASEAVQFKGGAQPERARAEDKKEKKKDQNGANAQKGAKDNPVLLGPEPEKKNAVWGPLTFETTKKDEKKAEKVDPNNADIVDDKGRRNDFDAPVNDETDEEAFASQRDNATFYTADAESMAKLEGTWEANLVAYWKKKDSVWVAKRTSLLATFVDEAFKLSQDALDAAAKKKQTKEELAAAKDKAKADVIALHPELADGAAPSEAAAHIVFERDKEHKNGLMAEYDAKGKDDKVYVGNRMCNTNALAMLIIDIVGSEARAKRIAADILSEKYKVSEYATKTDADLAKEQFEDILDRIVTFIVDDGLGASSAGRQAVGNLNAAALLFRTHKDASGKHTNDMGGQDWLGDSVEVTDAAGKKAMEIGYLHAQQYFTEPIMGGKAGERVERKVFGDVGVSIQKLVKKGHKFIVLCDTPGGGHYVALDDVMDDGVLVNDPYCANVPAIMDDTQITRNETGKWDHKQNRDRFGALKAAGGLDALLGTRFKHNAKSLETAKQMLAQLDKLDEAKAKTADLTKKKTDAEKAHKECKASVDKLNKANKAKKSLTQAEQTESATKNDELAKVKKEFDAAEKALTDNTTLVATLANPTPGKDGEPAVMGSWGKKCFYTFDECKGVRIPRLMVGYEKISKQLKDAADKPKEEKGKAKGTAPKP